MSTAPVNRLPFAPRCYNIYRCWLLALLFSLFTGLAHAQTAPAAAVQVQAMSGTLDSLYSALKNTTPDNVHRVCIVFMWQYDVRKDAATFDQFIGYLLDCAGKYKDRALLRRLRLIKAVEHLRYDKASPGQAEEVLESLYHDFVLQNDNSAALECLFELAQFNHRRTENKIQAIKVLFFAEKLAEKKQLQADISYAAILHKIGYILWELDKPIPSIEYFKKSLATGNGMQIDSLISLNGIGINYQKLDSLQLSMHYFNQASAAATAAGNHIFNTVVLGSAAVTLFKMGDYTTAYEYAMQEKKLSNLEGLWKNAAGDFYLLTQIELKRNKLHACKILLDSFTAIMTHIPPDDFESRKKQHEAAYLYYERLEDHKNALASYKQLMHYDSLYQEQGNKNKISELELKAEVKLYAEEMAEKDRARKRHNLLQSVLVVAVFIFTALVIYLLYKKIRRTEKDKLETEKINVQQAAEIETLKEQLLAQLETIRNGNMQFQALLTSKEAPAEETASEHTGNEIANKEAVSYSEEIGAPETSGDIQSLRAFNLTQKEQWKEFKNSFNKVYPDFERNIVGKIGSVSGAELRLMMLHKLGLANKDIAQTLLISPDSVKKGKYRLYKKIGINSAEELDAFLETV